MARGFDKNLLDPLIETIVNPSAPIPSKKRKRKQVQAQKKTKVAVQKIPKGPNYDKTGADDPYKASNFNEFVGKKIGSAFKSAALARKEFVDMGGSIEELEKGAFLKKALGFEFGGDKLARTQGMFSKTPDAFQDPALTRGQRFRAGISPLMSSTLPRPEPSTPGEAGVAPEVNIEPIQFSYSNIIDGFDFSAQNSDNSVKAEKEGADTIKEFNSLVEEIKDLIEEKNKNKRTKLQLQQDKLLAEADAAQTEKDLAKEAQLEGSKDTAGTRRTKFAGSQTPGEEEKEGKGGGGILGDLLGFGVEFLTEELIERGAKKLFQKGGEVAAKKAALGVGTTAAIVGGAGLAVSAIGEGFFQLTKKGGIGEQTRDLLKKKGEEIGGPLGAVVGATGDLAGISNEATKVTGAALDAIGAPFRYAIEAIRYPFLNKKDREKQAENLAKFDGRVREYTRGWMNRIDFLNIIPDEKGGFGNIYGNDKANKEMMKNMAGDEPTQPTTKVELPPPDPDESPERRAARLTREAKAEAGETIEGYSEPPEKLSEGAAPVEEYNPPEFIPEQGGERTSEDLLSPPGTPAMVGEAGNELVGTKEELSSMAATAIGKQTSDPIKESVRTILGVSSNIIGQTGLLGSAIRPFFEKEAAPLVKAFGLDDFTFTTDVGKGEGELKQAAQKQSEGKDSSGGLFGMLLNFLGMGGGKSTKGLPAAPGSGGPAGALSTGGGGGKITANQAYSYLISKGLSDNHAKGIVANISRESGFKLGAHNPNDPGAGSFGLFQWNGGRAEAMMAAVPDYLTNWKGQIDYALGEDYGPRYLSTNFNSPGEAAYDWMKYWERPAEYIQAKYTPAVYDNLITDMNLSQSGDPSSKGPVPPQIPKQQPESTSSSGGGITNMPQLKPQSPGVVPAAMPMAPAAPSAATPMGAYQSQGITPSTIMPLIQQPPTMVTPPAPTPPQPMYGPPKPESSNSFQRRLQLAILEKQN